MAFGREGRVEIADRLHLGSTYVPTTAGPRMVSVNEIWIMKR